MYIIKNCGPLKNFSVSKKCFSKRQHYIEKFLLLREKIPIDIVRCLLKDTNPNNKCMGKIYLQDDYYVLDMCPSCFRFNCL